MLIEEFEWKPEYELGVPIIDDAHREIFRMAKQLYLQSYLPDKGPLKAKSSLGFLKTYVIRHFAEEEAYMAANAYSGLEAHSAKHIRFREVILPNLEADLKADGYSGEALYRFLNILRLWLTQHIIGSDLEISRKG